MEELVSLVLNAQNGDAEAYSRLVGRFQDMAYGYAYAILGDFHLAEDATQEAFIEAYRGLPGLQAPLAFPAWFKRIVFKHCDRLTRRKNPPLVLLDDALAYVSESPSPAEMVERHEVAERVQAAIQALPVGQRLVTTLFYIDGYTQNEIADFLEVPAKTVKSRLHSSRQRLKERMLDMVEEELNSHVLPERFTEETVDTAVRQAHDLIGERHYDQAENLLREVLSCLPDHRATLKELNRLLMRGRVYGQGRWDLLPELAHQGERILQAGYDEQVARELAQTLLAMPAMQEAVKFLENWIDRKGKNLERLGMLSWARGCLADYEGAGRVWQEEMAYAHSQSNEENLSSMPFIAYTLVDCFSEAGQADRARRVAQQAWDQYGELGPVPFGHGLPGDGGWMMIFHQAGLDIQAIAHLLLGRHSSSDPIERGEALYLRAWADEPEGVLANWLEWVLQRIEAGAWSLLEQFRCVLFGLRGRGLWNEANRMAQATWELLSSSSSPGVDQARLPWNWERFNPVGAIRDRDWKTAEALSQRERQECGLPQGGPWAIVIAAAQGVANPPELVQALEQGGIDSIDEYGLFGWYLVARQAAFAGQAEKAFGALEKSLAYWANSPYFYVNIWENDRCWDGLRDQAEFKRLFAEKRRQIGPIYGMLHYFPGW